MPTTCPWRWVGQQQEAGVWEGLRVAGSKGGGGCHLHYALPSMHHWCMYTQSMRVPLLAAQGGMRQGRVQSRQRRVVSAQQVINHATAGMGTALLFWRGGMGPQLNTAPTPLSHPAPPGGLAAGVCCGGVPPRLHLPGLAGLYAAVLQRHPVQVRPKGGGGGDNCSAWEGVCCPSWALLAPIPR